MHTKVMRAAMFLTRISPSFRMTTEHNIDRLIPWRSQRFQQRAVLRKLSGERGYGPRGHWHAHQSDAGCTVLEAHQPELWHNH